MKFAHLADCHLGGWRDPELREIGMKSFERAIETALGKDVDFILIAGDLFDTTRPAIDVMERAVTAMRKAREEGIQIYVIEGSHDFSATGKTMLRVLEKTGLFTRVSKGEKTDDGKLRLYFETDEATGAKITGLPGRSGSLESKYFEQLDRDSLAEEEGFKVFMFHSGLEELKPSLFEYAKAMPVSLLPKGMDYYAGGHIHKNGVYEVEDGGVVVFPGPTMPTNFRELEALENGGFYICTVDDGKIRSSWHGLDTYEVVKIQIDAEGRTPESVESDVSRRIEEESLGGKVVLLRIEGILKSGKPSDIDFRGLITKMKDKGVKTVKRNTSKLSAAEYEEVKVTTSNREELENRLIEENAGQIPVDGRDKEEQIRLTKALFEILSKEKQEDETNDDYQTRLREEILQELDLSTALEGFV